MEIFTILIKKFLIKLWMVKKSLKRMRYILIKFLFYQLEESDIEEELIGLEYLNEAKISFFPGKHLKKSN